MPATKPEGGNARSRFSCFGSAALTQGKYNAALMAFAPVRVPLGPPERVAKVTVSLLSTMRKAR